MNSTDYIPSTLFWLPISADSGLFQLGAPDRAAPVVVTVNNWFNVRALQKYLRGRNLYLLVLDCRSVDIYVAVVSGRFDALTIHAALQEHELAEKVDHRDLILPAWSVSAELQHDVWELSEWECHFAPTALADLPRYLSGRDELGARAGEFPLEQRLHLALGSAFLFTLAMLIPAWYTRLASWGYWLLLPWVAYLSAASLYDRLSSPTNLGKGIALGLLGSLVLAAVYVLRPDMTFATLLRGVTITMLMCTWVGWSIQHPAIPSSRRGLLLAWTVILGAYFLARRWG